MDKTLRTEICREVKAAMTKQLEEVNEVWMCERELLAQFQMFTHDWLKRYGCTLPRTRIILTDANGETRQSAWAYGRNQIQRMILDNRIKQLRVDKL